MFSEEDQKRIEKEMEELQRQNQQQAEEQKEFLKQQTLKRRNRTNDNRESGIKLNSDIKKYLTIGGICLSIFLVFCILKEPVTYYVEDTLNGVEEEFIVKMPDLTQYDEADAVDMLYKMGLTNIQRVYLYDSKFDDKTVVKTNIIRNTAINDLDVPIILYICDESLFFGNDEKPENDNIQAESGQHISLNGIRIISFISKDNKFYAVIKNTNSYAITKINYIIGYNDENNISIGERIYQLDQNLVILPNEKYLISGDIKNLSAYSMEFNKFTFTKIEVPENER